MAASGSSEKLQPCAMPNGFWLSHEEGAAQAGICLDAGTLLRRAKNTPYPD